MSRSSGEPGNGQRGPGLLFGGGDYRPRRETIQLTAEITKKGSYDFYCAHTENQGVYGYDLVTELGSNLTCTGQRATIEDRGMIEIVRQNFGFDLERGLRTVDLNPMQEHYYLEVRGSIK